MVGRKLDNIHQGSRTTRRVEAKEVYTQSQIDSESEWLLGEIDRQRDSSTGGQITYTDNYTICHDCLPIW